DLNVISTTTAQITAAAFTVSPATPAPGSTVTFTQDSSSPPGSTYTWNFGDGTTTGSRATVTHTYSSRGSYPVTLTIQTGSNTTQSTGTVNVDSAPTSAFTQSAPAVLPGATVSFDGSTSTAAAGGSIADYSWNFGDGTTGQDGHTVATTSHTFNTPGVYTVTLTTTDDLGATAAVSHQVTVDDPAAAFTSAQSTGTTESFNAAGTTDPESTITDYSWNFGDGSSTDAGSSPTTSHAFNGPGTYTVTLTVTDQLGLTSTSTQQVSVAPVSTQSSGTSTPPTTNPTPTPVSPPVPSPPSPPSSSGGNGAPHANPVVAKVTGSGRQRLSTVKAHGLRLGLAVNQTAAASIQITIPVTQTTEGGSATHGTRHGSAPPVVLLRSSRSLGPGSHGLVLRLSRGALGQLTANGPLVVTVRVTFTGSGGRTVTRTLKITLTR
ncbi:MAG: PKD domain-containing protein, partial [Solirubrobacterales bacterium]|nr:PKD domain-containing protein [Solirubrobacterales bacterium]